MTKNPVDIDPPGPSVGDRLEFTANLTIDGKDAGELTGVLTTQTVGKSDGTSVVKEKRSVVGGTGAYANAKGSVSTVRNADGTYTHTFTLTA